MFFSPVSLKIVLSILYEGSSGSTKNELEYVLGIQDEAVLRKQYQNLINILKVEMFNVPLSLKILTKLLGTRSLLRR